MDATHGTMRDLPEADRPYEKLRALGAGALTDAELLSVLIRTGTRSESSLALAQRILPREGPRLGLAFLADASVEELSAHAGIGRVKAAVLKAAVEVGRRATRGPAARPGERITDPESLAEGLLDEMRFLAREELWVLLLDAKGALIRLLRFAGGGVAATVVTPRDLFREAVRCGASGVILAHNHPSGDPEPSEDDLRTTARVREAGEAIGVRLVDHLVVAAGGSVSLRRRGLV